MLRGSRNSIERYLFMSRHLRVSGNIDRRLQMLRIYRKGEVWRWKRRGGGRKESGWKCGLLV